MKLIYKTLLFLFFLAQTTVAQLVTDNAKTADDLVKNILAGGGVVISNVTYTGHITSIGQFNGAASNIGLNSGVILSSGTVLDELDALGRQNGPIGPNNSPQASSRFNNPGDADLSGLVGGRTSFDAAVLEFDFIPEGDTVRFRYVFASEEYPEWVGTVNNDAFGFFISGPGITGKKNIALLPDNVTAVSINSVNAGSNASYFVNNGTGSAGTSQFTNNTVVNYDGFTKVLEAISVVQPCKSYHLKIVIADITDDAMNSAVFLEANSLNSAPNFTIDQGSDYNASGSANILFEDCSNGELKISRTQNLTSTLSIPFKIYGTASAGTDYTSITPLVTFAVGETEKKIFLETLQDGITETDETVIFRFKNPSVCDNDSINIAYVIKDQTKLITSTIIENVVCPLDSKTITAVVVDGVSGFTYTWLGSASTSSSLTVNPLLTTKYYYTVTDACSQVKTDSITVNVPVYLPINVTPMSDLSIRCPGTILNFEVNPINGAGDYKYLWSNGETTKIMSSEILVDNSFSVKVTDKCLNEISDSVSVLVNYPPISAIVDKDTIVCYGDEIKLSGEGFGGIPPYEYFWNDVKGKTYDHLGVRTQKLYFSVYDSCSLIPANDSVNVVVQKPLARFEINAPLPEPNQTIYLINTSENATQYIWDFGNEESSLEIKPSTKYREIGIYTVTLIVVDELMCKDTAISNIEIVRPFYVFFPSAFTPDGNGLNDLFIGVSEGSTEFFMRIFDRWGNKMFETTDPLIPWDGTTITGAQAPEGVYVVRYKSKSIYRPEKEYETITTVTLVR